MDPADSTWLTIALEKILSVFGQGQHRLQGIAADLVVNLAILEISVLLLWATLDGGAQVSGIIKRVIFISVVYWGITHYDIVVEVLVDSFVSVGEVAGSGGGSSTLSVNDPGGIFLQGVTLTRPWSEATGKSIWRWGISDVWRTFFWFAIVIAFGLLAIQVWLTRLEFGVLSCLGLIFLPLSVWKHGKWIAEKILGAYIAVAGKLMALAFIVSVIAPILKEFQVSANGSFEDEANVVVAIFALLMLAWKAPNMIMAFLSGGAVIGLSSAGVVPRTGELIAGSAGFAGGVSSAGGRALGRTKGFIQTAMGAAGITASTSSASHSRSSSSEGNQTNTTNSSQKGSPPAVDMSSVSKDLSNGNSRLRSSSLDNGEATAGSSLTPPKVRVKPPYNTNETTSSPVPQKNSAHGQKPQKESEQSLDTPSGPSTSTPSSKSSNQTQRSLAKIRHGLSEDSEVSGNVFIPIRTDDD